MARNVRPIRFYSLDIDFVSTNFTKKEFIINLFDFIINKDKEKRKYNFSSDKVGFLFNFNNDFKNNFINAIFKSSTRGYRSPLLDNFTLIERENPKTLTEGERYKTHFNILFKNDMIYIILETFKGSISYKQLENYFKNFIQKYKAHIKFTNQIDFNITPLASESFIKEIEKQQRVILADLFIDKVHLGSKFFNISNRTVQSQKNFVLSVKAERGNNLIDYVKDVYNKINQGNFKAIRLKVQAKTQQNSIIRFDTDFIERKEDIKVKIDKDTGEINSQDIIRQLNEISLRV